jgi:hypothetical protein
MTAEREVLDTEAIHSYFGLTYANYLVLHRTVLQCMPASWQREFVALLQEAREASRDVPGIDVDFWVRAKDERGHFVRDQIPHYRRGRVELRPTRCASCGSRDIYEEGPAEGWHCNGCGRNDADE